VRCPVVRPDVRLDLDDAADTPSGVVVADETGADQRASRLEGGPLEKRPVDDAQADG
jgi:hypothetical protein